MEITAFMKIEEVVRRYPETIRVFDRYGVACLECCGAEVDSVERGARIHGIDLDQLLRELNACLAGRG
jgi:hybrid cluster-associated redox disulfide protein